MATGAFFSSRAPQLVGLSPVNHFTLLRLDVGSADGKHEQTR